MGRPRRRISSKRLESKKSYLRNVPLRIRVTSKNFRIQNRLFRKLLHVTSKTGHFEISHTTNSITSKKGHVDNGAVRKKLLRITGHFEIFESYSFMEVPLFRNYDFEVTHSAKWSSFTW